MEEEQSRDEETRRINAPVGLAAFDSGAIGSVPCFLAGTQIATPQGPRAFESLSAGELLRTADGGTARLRLSLSRTVAANATQTALIVSP